MQVVCLIGNGLLGFSKKRKCAIGKYIFEKNRYLEQVMVAPDKPLGTDLLR